MIIQAWLSFANPSKPPRESFNGVCIVEVESDEPFNPYRVFRQAINRAWALDINPGGECMPRFYPAGTFAQKYVNRLLTKEELIATDLGESTLDSKARQSGA